MSFFTYRNTKLLINGNPYFCNNASINESNSVSPSYSLDNQYNDRYAADNGINGSLKFSYLLTGSDELINNISNEKNIISANFGGLNFQTGYLKSYSFNLTPNNPVVIDAEIVFFDSLSGSFSPNFEIVPELQCLNVANASIVNTLGGAIGTISNVTNFSYNYNIDIQPQYNIDKKNPERAVFGIKEVTVDLTSDKTDGFISVSGQKVSLRTKLVHPTNTNIYQNFDCKGVLVQKDFTSSAGNILSNKISIKQNNLSQFNLPDPQNTPLPIIYFFNSNTGYNGSLVTITGKNLSDVQYISYGNNAFDYNFQIINDNHIKSFVAPDAISGPITLYNTAGSKESSDDFLVGGLPIYINDISPITGYIGDKIIISGDNFYEVSRVLFNDNQNAIFNQIDNNLIQTTIPPNVSWGYIDVISDVFSLSGISPTKFAPFPSISGYSSSSGFSGDYIIISGAAFSGITGIKINNLPTGNTDVFTIVNNTGIYLQVPSGNTNGIIKLYGQSGVSEITDNSFYAYALLTGISSLSGHTGDLISLSGRNFIPEILYNFGSNRFAVGFAGGVTGYFQRTNNILLSGSVPSGAQSGIIHLYSNNQQEYPSDISFIVRNNTPIINSFSPYSGKRQDYVSIIGDEFNNITGIIVTGNSTGVNISSSNYNVSVNQDYINFQIPLNITGGKYDIIISTIEGNSRTGTLNILEYPYVSGFLPVSGVQGQLISVSGLNLYPLNLTNVYFDSGLAQTDITSFTSSNNQLNTYVPSSLESGLHNLSVYNSVGYKTGVIQFHFIPQIIISGFSQQSGTWGDVLVSSGRYFNYFTSGQIGNIRITNYTITNNTGYKFTIPDDSVTSPLKLYNIGNYTLSNNNLTIIQPLISFSGFRSQETYYNSGIIISGYYTQTLTNILFSGLDGREIPATNYTGISNTGIYVLVPTNVSGNSLIKLSNQRGNSYSPYNITLIPNPTLSSINKNTGFFNDQIFFSGINLSGSVPFFRGSGNQLVPGLSVNRVGNSGLYFNVPHDIISGNIVVKSRNDTLVSWTGVGFSPSF